MNKLHGIFSALVTPMTSLEVIDYNIIRELVEYQISLGVEGFYCCGSSGEALLLSLEERIAIVDTVVKAVAGRVPVIAHVGTIRTADTIILASEAKKSGVDAISMIPPYYYKFTQEEILMYYRQVLDATGMPIIIYNIPQFTGVSFDKHNAESLLNDEKIIGVKHTSTDLYALERMRDAFPKKIYFNGFDEMFLSSLVVGAQAAIGTTVNLFAPRFLKVRDHFKAGRMEAALIEQTKINQGVELLVKHGIFNGVKYALTLQGLHCGSCRAPFKPLTDEAKKEIKIAMQELIC
ncbi:MAG: N-acetylneuraminate lyase [Spirochaetia bacterium]|nr:N-acetylneuraminate lyase [Spirochaetia bacterium]